MLARTSISLQHQMGRRHTRASTPAQKHYGFTKRTTALTTTVDIGMPSARPIHRPPPHVEGVDANGPHEHLRQLCPTGIAVPPRRAWVPLLAVVDKVTASRSDCRVTRASLRLRASASASARAPLRIAAGNNAGEPPGKREREMGRVGGKEEDKGVEQSFK